MRSSAERGRKTEVWQMEKYGKASMKMGKGQCEKEVWKGQYEKGKKEINIILKLFIKPTGSHIINDCIRSIKSTYHRFLAFLGSDHSTTTASTLCESLLRDVGVTFWESDLAHEDSYLDALLSAQPRHNMNQRVSVWSKVGSNLDSQFLIKFESNHSKLESAFTILRLCSLTLLSQFFCHFEAWLAWVQTYTKMVMSRLGAQPISPVYIVYNRSKLWVTLGHV